MTTLLLIFLPNFFVPADGFEARMALFAFDKWRVAFETADETTGRKSARSR